MRAAMQNTDLKIEVEDFGAVLSSIKSQKTGHEFLWQGNPAIWNGQSPILFPIIGKLLNDRCVIGGKTYEIIRHGLARHRAFQCVEQTDSKLVFLQTENEDTLLHYPYCYELYITFSLDGNRLTVTHTVKNTNDYTMHFSGIVGYRRARPPV